MTHISQPKHIHNAMVGGRYTADSELLMLINAYFYKMHLITIIN